MFDRNRKYDLSKAQQNLSREEPDLASPVRQPTPSGAAAGSPVASHYNKYNAHVNLAFNRSNEDQELNDFDKINSVDLSPPPIRMRSPSKLRRLRSPSKQHDEMNFERGETIFFERKSIIPELETVIKWDHLEFEVHSKGKTKRILDNVSGEVNNLEIMAILGPSGAGKSTLLNTIAGRIKSSDYSGSVNFYSKDKRITFAYVPQVDQLTPYLTVKESLLFSSKLKNSSDTNHVEEVEFVLTAFNLWKAKNHYSFRCSGGERKRLSIGLEMISKPKILILDEPTSGLDSTTSYIVIEVLKNINKNTAIITTIHQPNSNLFQLFDKCYILTAGKCIFNGTPSTIVDHLKDKFNAVCPNFTNPADFILDIANDIKTETGLQLIERLAAYEKEENDKRNLDSSRMASKLDVNGNDQLAIIMNNLNNLTHGHHGNHQSSQPPALSPPQHNNKAHTNGNQHGKNGSRMFRDPINGREVELAEIYRSSFKRKFSFFKEYFLNVNKLIVCSLRDPQQTIFRLMNSVVFPIVLYITVTGEQAKESGCTFLPLNATHIQTENIYERYDRQLKGIQGAGLTFINLMFIYFSAMVPAILVLSQHINVLRKEYMNSYYTANSFFCSIITVNLLLGFVYSTANTFSYFFFTGQIYETKKFLLFWLIIFLTSILGDLFGLWLSIVYPEENLTAVVMGGFGGFALHTLSGFFVPINTMREAVQTFSWFIFCRHVFEAAMRTFYGHGKCKISDSMIFDFDNLIDFVKYYNYENDGKLQDVEDMPLKVRNALREKLWNRSSIFEMAETMNDLDEEEMDRLSFFWEHKTSYILDSFDLNNPDLRENLVIILITIGFFMLLCYVTLLMKLKK